jgi:shikimate dehydrogenase
MRNGLIGETLAHSHSPRLHALLGDADYALCPLPPDRLAAFLTKRDFLGLNVTIPYKRDVMPYCAELSDTARAIGSVNTIVKRADGTLFGDNTDAFGFARMAAAAGISFTGRKALVLGSGGTSRTACHVVRQAGGQAVVISRTGENGYDTLQHHADAAVIINTTPVGMYPAVDASPVDLAMFPNLVAVLDVVYNPLRTKLLQQAAALGLPHAGGLTMLTWQAVRARELFDGVPVSDSLATDAQHALRREVSNLVLVGMPGSGKTTVGRRCARALGLTAVDTDAEITRRTGKHPKDIITMDGEAAFRALEAEVIADLGSRRGLVISTGGGAVLRAENRLHLRMNGVVAYLSRPLDRLSTGGRPLSQIPGALQSLLETRQPLYEAAADYTVRNDGTLAGCVRQVLEGFDEAFRH